MQEPVEVDELTRLRATLSITQNRYVLARLGTKSDTAAAKKCGIPDGTLRAWQNKRDVDRVIELMLERSTETALEMLTGSIVQAATVKVNGLNSRDEKVKQSVATEILNRGLGEPEQNIKMGVQLIWNPHKPKQP